MLTADPSLQVFSDDIDLMTNRVVALSRLYTGSNCSLWRAISSLTKLTHDRDLLLTFMLNEKPKIARKS
jgi:hypothetical protein